MTYDQEEYFKEKLDSDGVWRPKTLKEYSQLAKMDHRLKRLEKYLKPHRLQYAFSADVFEIHKPTQHEYLRDSAVYVIEEIILLFTELCIQKKDLGAVYSGCIVPQIGAFPGERSPDRRRRKWDKRRTTWTRWQVKHPCLLAVLNLENYLQGLPHHFYGYKYCDEYWPKIPFVELFGEIGLAALEVAIDLGWSVLKMNMDVMRQSFNITEDMSLDSFVKKVPVVLEPNLDLRAEHWHTALREAFISRFPSTEWPEGRLSNEVWKWSKLLNYEAGAARKALEKANISLVEQRKNERIMKWISLKEADKKAQSKFPTHIRAILYLYNHPDWSVTQIAKEVGVNRTTLYKNDLFKEALKKQRERNKKSWPQGSKDGKTGEMEAWDEPDNDS